MNKPARTIKQATIRAIARNYNASYGYARKLYERYTKEDREQLTGQFHWINNNRNTPRPEGE